MNKERSAYRRARAAIFDRDDGRCFHCGRFVSPKNFHVDHLVPHSHGGRATPDNLVTSCVTCNLNRSATYPSDNLLQKASLLGALDWSERYVSAIDVDRRTHPGIPNFLTTPEVERFRDAVKSGGAARDLALFGLMYWFGLRAQDVTQLRLGDVDLVRSRLRVRRRGRVSQFPLPQNIEQHLQCYLKERIDRGSFLFTGRESTNRHGLRVLQVQRLFKKYAVAAGFSRLIASDILRHSIAVHLMATGWGLERIQDLLGHRSAKSTEIYAPIASALREIHPDGRSL